MFWSDLVDLLRAAILGVAQVCNGSVGTAVILVSFAIRLALLPLTLRLARRARERQRRLTELKPALEKIQRRYAGDPAAMWNKTSALYRKHDVRPIDGAGFIGALVQSPVFIALYSALRRGLGDVHFLWINVANGFLSLIVATLTGVALWIAPTPEAFRNVQILNAILMAAMMLWFLSSTSALFALSTGAGSLVGILQACILRRDDATARNRQRSVQ